MTDKQTSGENQAAQNPSYDKSLPIKQRVGDFLGAFHIVLNGVVAHEPFDLTNEGRPGEMCDTDDKERFIEFVELLVSQVRHQEREKLKGEISEQECLPEYADNTHFSNGFDHGLARVLSLLDKE